MYRPVVPVYTRFLDRSISAFQSISRNSEGHVESVQPIKCLIFILICNKQHYVIKFVSDLASQWFSLSPPVSSTNKTDRQDITEILLKVELNTINQTKPINSIIKDKTSEFYT